MFVLSHPTLGPTSYPEPIPRSGRPCSASHRCSKSEALVPNKAGAMRGTSQAGSAIRTRSPFGSARNPLGAILACAARQASAPPPYHALPAKQRPHGRWLRLACSSSVPGLLLMAHLLLACSSASSAAGALCAQVHGVARMKVVRHRGGADALAHGVWTESNAPHARRNSARAAHGGFCPGRAEPGKFEIRLGFDSDVTHVDVTRM